MMHSLRDETADYAFRQVFNDILLNCQKLKSSMEKRFREKRSASSHVNKHRENMAEYVPEIKRLVLKGCPTADSMTIDLNHFLNSLLATQAALHPGMKDQKSIEDLSETYQSLREEVSRAMV